MNSNRKVYHLSLSFAPAENVELFSTSPISSRQKLKLLIVQMYENFTTLTWKNTTCPLVVLNLYVSYMMTNCTQVYFYFLNISLNKLQNLCTVYMLYLSSLVVYIYLVFTCEHSHLTFWEWIYHILTSARFLTQFEISIINVLF